MTQNEWINVGDIIVEPIPYIEIDKMEIRSQYNDHAYFFVEGKIEETAREQLDGLLIFGAEIAAKKTDGSILFHGLLTEIEIEEQGEVYHVKAKGVSHTLLLDRERKTRPFHEVTKSIEDLIRAVTQGYPTAKVAINEICNKPINQFIMQYEETDWEFIKRLASHCNLGLFADRMLNFPGYYVGKPNFDINMKTEESILFRINKEENAGMIFTSYTINANDVQLKMGECIRYKGMELYVRSSQIKLEQAILNNYYELCFDDRLMISKRFNDNLAGKSVPGIVEKIDRDYVYTGIVAENSNGEACWFPYSTVYASSNGSGWYCMPESGDKVRIQFPDKDEKNAYAISSISENQSEGATSKTRDYSRRYIRNKQGMEVAWTPERITISSNGASLVDINQNGTLFLSATSKIVIHSENDVVIAAGNRININGGDGVHINCGAKAEINMDKDGVIELKGNEVYTN